MEFKKVGTEAGIFWNPKVFEVRKIEVKDDFKYQYSKVIENRGRLCICEVEYKSNEQEKRLDYNKRRYSSPDKKPPIVRTIGDPRLFRALFYRSKISIRFRGKFAKAFFHI